MNCTENLHDIKFLQTGKFHNETQFYDHLNRLDCVIGDIALSNLKTENLFDKLSILPEREEPVSIKNLDNNIALLPKADSTKVKHKMNLVLQYNQIDDIYTPLQAFVKQQLLSTQKDISLEECITCKKVEIIQTEQLSNARQWREQLMSQYTTK
jgi:hypothetical protein